MESELLSVGLRVRKGDNKMIRLAYELTVKIGRLWCRITHDSVTWPSHGHYHCRLCLREYSVPWAPPPQSAIVPMLRPSASYALTRVKRAA